MAKKKKTTKKVTEDIFGYTNNFTAEHSKQIADRFKAVYDLLTAKNWIQEDFAKDEDGYSVDPATDEGRKVAKSFCLIGAVQYINGPTEEEIKALILLTILGIEDNLSYIINDHWDDHHYCDDNGDSYANNVDKLFKFYYDLVNDDNNEILFERVYEWNDEDGRTHEEVRAMLKKAMKLYDKLMKLDAEHYPITVEIANKLEQIEKIKIDLETYRIKSNKMNDKIRKLF